jgi:hypothetical protein
MSTIVPGALMSVIVNAVKKSFAIVEAAPLSEAEQIAFEQSLIREIEGGVAKMLSSSVETAVHTAVSGFLSRLLGVNLP